MDQEDIDADRELSYSRRSRWVFSAKVELLRQSVDEAVNAPDLVHL